MSKKPSGDQIAELAMFAAKNLSVEEIQAIIDKRIVITPQASESGLPPHHYRITVTSTATPTYAERKLAYDWVSDVWNKSEFTLELHESLCEIVPSTGDKVVFVKKFDRDTTSDQAIEWAHKNGYRLAFPTEREAFTKANPELQRKVWIVDLGSFLVYDGRRCVPVLHGNDGERGLGRHWFGYGWRASYRFLFVREDGSKESVKIGEKARDQKSMSEDQAKKLCISGEGFHWLVSGWPNEDGSRGIFRKTQF
ncbi:MAG: hypothetical protein NUW08_01930 [Candidatus Uhrbacteria bacterium]|nr:hypothetical protein [Candidatus Uhrbacteria bacterium]